MAKWAETIGERLIGQRSDLEELLRKYGRKRRPLEEVPQKESRLSKFERLFPELMTEERPPFELPPRRRRKFNPFRPPLDEATLARDNIPGREGIEPPVSLRDRLLRGRQAVTDSQDFLRRIPSYEQTFGFSPRVQPEGRPPTQPSKTSLATQQVDNFITRYQKEAAARQRVAETGKLEIYQPSGQPAPEDIYQGRPLGERLRTLEGNMPWSLFGKFAYATDKATKEATQRPQFDPRFATTEQAAEMRQWLAQPAGQRVAELAPKYLSQVLDADSQLWQEYGELGLVQQTLYELPFWALTFGTSATGLRASLGPVIKAGGKKGAAAELLSGALAPVAGVEEVTGIVVKGGLKYGIALPVKSVLTPALKIERQTLRAFENGLDNMIDQWIGQSYARSKWVATQSRLTEQDWQYRLLRLIMGNRSAIEKSATDNFLRYQAEARAGRMSAEAANMEAVKATINDIEIKLLPRGTQTGAMEFGGKAVPPSGDAIAKELGVTFNGIQQGTKDVPDMMLFTDSQTGSTFSARSPVEARTKLTEMRQKFAQTEVAPTPEVTERITRTTKQQDIQETAKILSAKLKENGIAEEDIADLLDVYSINIKATETRASLTFEQLRNLADEGITEENVRKLTREILAKEFGVPSSEVDIVLGGGSRTNPRLDVQQAETKAREIDNLIKANLPTHKDILASLNKPVSATPEVLKQFPPYVDNYRKPLTTYTDTLYHETDIEGLFGLMPQNTGYWQGDIYFANTPELALGQRTNKGVHVKFSAEGIEGQLNKKPAWELLYKQNQAEFIDKHPQEAILKSNIQEVTIDPSAKGSRGQKIAVDRWLSSWSKTVNPDGSLTYRPAALPTAEAVVRQVPGEPEAGLQKGMFERDVEVRPPPPGGEGVSPVGAGGQPPAARPPKSPRQPPPSMPEPPPSITPGPMAQNIIGLRTIQPGLTRQQTINNWMRRQFGEAYKKVGGRDLVLEDALATPAIVERARVAPIIESQANDLAAKIKVKIAQTFKLDKQGRLTALADVVPEVGAPTIQDVAARLPLYADSLTTQELQVFSFLKESVKPYHDLMVEVGVELRSRADVVEGGFYLPRSFATPEGADLPYKVGGGRGGMKKGFEKPAVFDSMAQGIEAGWTYPSVSDAVANYARGAGQRATDAHVVNYLKALTDDTGNLLGETPKMRMLRQHPEIARPVEDIKANLVKLKANIGALTQRQMDVIDLWANDPEFADVSEVIISLQEGLATMKAGTPPQTLTELRTLLKQNIDGLKALKPEYDRAMRQAQVTPREQGAINVQILPGLQGRTFPLELANAINIVLNREGTLIGRGAGVMQTTVAFNALWAMAHATADLSAAGIQGLLLAYNHPTIWSKAFRLNVKTLFNDKVAGKYLLKFDTREKAAGRLTSSEWNKSGSRMSGETGFLETIGVSKKIMDAPIIKQTNRAFSLYGDVARKEWNSSELRAEMAKGRTLEEITASGDLERISFASNVMTGWSQKGFGSSIGDTLLFAPRWLQSRLSTLTLAAKGLRPGATKDQAMARNAILKLIGFGVLTTVAINAAQGEDTDFRLIVDGKRNPHFMRVKVPLKRGEAMYVSLFGSWDSLVGMITHIGGGRPLNAVRNMGSGTVAVAFDILTGRDYQWREVGSKPVDPVKLSQWILRSALPYAWGDVPETYGLFARGEIIPGAGRLAGEALGVKTFVTSRLESEWESDLKDYFDIPSNVNEVKADRKKYPFTRAGYRKQFPEVDAKLFITGQVTSLSEDAKPIAVRLMRENGISVDDIPSLKKTEFETEAHKRLRIYFEQALGEIEKAPAPVPVETEPVTPRRRRKNNPFRRD